MPTILVVDDSNLTRRLICKALTSEGFDVIQASHGEEGFEQFQKHSPDCIMSDLLMPVLDGFGFAQKVREVDRNIPLLIATADIQEHSKMRCEQIGVTKMLNKPLKPEQICEAVQSALNQRAETV